MKHQTQNKQLLFQVFMSRIGMGRNFMKRASGGGSGIRTHVTLSRKHAFQACALSHSAIPPKRQSQPAGRLFGSPDRTTRAGRAKPTGRSVIDPSLLRTGSIYPPAKIKPFGRARRNGARSCRPLRCDGRGGGRERRASAPLPCYPILPAAAMRHQGSLPGVERIRAGGARPPRCLVLPEP